MNFTSPEVTSSLQQYTFDGNRLSKPRKRKEK